MKTLKFLKNIFKWQINFEFKRFNLNSNINKLKESITHIDNIISDMNIKLSLLRFAKTQRLLSEQEIIEEGNYITRIKIMENTRKRLNEMYNISLVNYHKI